MAFMRELLPAFWAPTTHTSPLIPTISCMLLSRPFTPVPFTLLIRWTAAGEGRPACLHRRCIQLCMPGFSLAHSLTCSLNCSLACAHLLAHTHSFTHSLTHSLTNALIHSLAHSLTHSLAPSLPPSLPLSLTPSPTHLLTHPPACLPAHPCNHTLIVFCFEQLCSVAAGINHKHSQCIRSGLEALYS